MTDADFSIRVDQAAAPSTYAWVIVEQGALDVDIYRSITNRRKFVALPAGLPPGAVPFPDADLASLASFKLRHRFNPEAAYQGADAADIARQIERNGFAVFFES